jgi:hypothetical protein
MGLFAAPHESECVQFFGRRHDEPFRTLWRPASKKRQGTKSREVALAVRRALWGFDGGAELEGGYNPDRMRPADQTSGEIGSV